MMGPGKGVNPKGEKPPVGSENVVMSTVGTSFPSSRKSVNLKIGSPCCILKSLKELFLNPQFKFPTNPASTFVAACMMPSRSMVVVGVIRATPLSAI
jgi:hypothetical protein